MRRLGLGFVLLLAVAVSLQTAVIKQPPNYQVVANAARNILLGDNPYAPQTGLDFYKYSPLAGLLMAPFLFLPDTVGMFLFVVLQAGLFIWAFWRWSPTSVLATAGIFLIAVEALSRRNRAWLY